MRESDIMYETPCGNYWVGRDKKNKAYVVYENRLTYSYGESGYNMDSDGLSIAICRAKYLAKRNKDKGLNNVEI